MYVDCQWNRDTRDMLINFRYLIEYLHLINFNLHAKF